jgi:hypothetical protein
MVPDNGNNGTELIMSGGSQTNKTEIPAWLEDSARDNLAMGKDVANIGYTPYYGPDVAAFTPMQEAAFQSTGQAAGAFGMPGGGMTGMEGMPQAQTFAGGVRGYSSAPMYEEALAQLEANNPGQFAAIQAMFMDPQTGLGGYQQQQQQEQQAAQQYSGGGGGDGGRYATPGGGGNQYQGPNQNGDAGYGSSGYSSFGDMFDGGGAGTSGDTYSGGGLISNTANRVTDRFGGSKSSKKSGFGAAGRGY